MNAINLKEKLIEEIKNERKELESMLSGISNEQMLLPGVQGEWSIKDILIHLSVWEQRGLGWIKAIGKGENPHVPKKGYSWNDFDHLNEEVYQKYRDTPLNEVLSTFNKSFENLIETLQEFPEAQLEQTFYSEGARNQHFLGKDVIFWRSLHYKSHNQHIKIWLEKKNP